MALVAPFLTFTIEVSTFCFAKSSRIIRPSASSPTVPTNAARIPSAAAKVLHLDGHNAAGAIVAAKVAREAGVTIMYDAGTHRDGMNELLPLADLLICSEEFILKLTGLKDAEEAVRQVWAKYHPKVCGATMGVRGSMAFDGKYFVRCPAFKVEKVVDTTGCGDLFHTGFAIRYLETQDLMECQRFGAAVSAIKCRGLSGRPPSAPTRAEVEAFLNQ